MHARAQLAAAAHELLDAQRLQREGDVHDRGRVALGRGEVDDAAAREQVQAPVAEVVLLDERPDLAHVAGASSRSAPQVDLDVEVAGVGEHGAVLHALEVLAPSTSRVARDGDEDVAALGRVERGHDLEALHARLERRDRVDLADDDRGARAARPLGDAAARPAVAEDDERAAGEQQVRRAQDAVERRLAGPVAVVEDALGARLVDRETGHASRPSASRRADADEARRRLLDRRRAGRPARSGPAACRTVIRSAPSSIVTCGSPASSAPTFAA